MNRAAINPRARCVVVLLLAGLLAVPFAAADDYAHLQATRGALGSARAPAVNLEDSSSEVTESEGAAAGETLCLCSICVAALDDPPCAVAPPLQRRGMAIALFSDLLSSSYRTKVYRPPIV